MESYIARVEFLDPSDSDYYNLYSAMERRGFSRHILCDEAGYHFPLKEYYYSGNANLNHVLALITEAAQEILKPCTVEIFESNGMPCSESMAT